MAYVLINKETMTVRSEGEANVVPTGVVFRG
jgi:hypothetical protein